LEIKAAITPIFTVLVDNSPIRQANYRIRWKTFPAMACGMGSAVRSGFRSGIQQSGNQL
jgi:hypothetical protein